MRDLGGYDISAKTALVLEESDTYRMINMPDWFWLDDGQSHGKLRSETGTWALSLDADRPYWTLQLRGKARIKSIAITGQHSPYVLHFSFGNIDTNPHDILFLREK